jgi:ABC-2 type transport system permease protein
MKNTLTIFRRELGSYFNSPIGYIVITVFLLFSGWLFFDRVFLYGEASVRGYLELTPLIFVFFCPAVTMRLLAEEKRTGTIEYLITMPVSDWQVVLGKFLAALAVIAVAVLLTLAYPITLDRFGDMDWGVVFGGYLGLLLMGGAYIAIGIAASSWTSDQVVSFIVAFGITFTLFLLGQLLPLMPPALRPVLGYLSVHTHFENLAKGVVDLRDLVYYGSLIVACLFLAVQSLDSRRWR